MTQQSPKTEQIAARAYQLYLERGRTDGHDVDDWLQAEYELIQLPVRKIAEMAPPSGGARQTQDEIHYRARPHRHVLVDTIPTLTSPIHQVQPATAALSFYSDENRHGGR